MRKILIPDHEPRRHDMNEPLQIALFIASCLFAFIVFQAILTGWADPYFEQLFMTFGVL